MLWQRSEPRNPLQDVPPSIPGSDILRQAALQASWQRDRRVAQRRIAWRWIVWYLQRFSPHVLIGATVLAGSAYLTGSLPSWSDSVREAPTPSPVHVPYAAPSVATTPPPVQPVDPAMATQDTTPIETPLTLRASLVLQPRTADPLPVPDPRNSADTLTLKPEHWLHSKEP